MRIRRPWWTYWRTRERKAVRLIQWMEHRYLYCLVRRDLETGNDILLNSVEPTGLWLMASVDDTTTDLWTAAIRMSNSQTVTNPVRSRLADVEMTVSMMQECLRRARAVGINLWETPLIARRVTMETVNRAVEWLTTHRSKQVAPDLTVTTAVDQLIAETAPTGKETS